ncbi:WD40 repeat-like protein [Ramicandelaber brevisporus]|nr:WD40 repeat-like protein [Ramicandelaber brevisporus]
MTRQNNKQDTAQIGEGLVTLSSLGDHDDALDQATLDPSRLSSAGLRALEERRRRLGEYEFQRVRRFIPAPTDDARVRARLCELFDMRTYEPSSAREGAFSRRERLLDELARRPDTPEHQAALARINQETTSAQPTATPEAKEEASESESEDEAMDIEMAPTLGSEALLGARREIAIFSLHRARVRLQNESQQKQKQQLQNQHVRNPHMVPSQLRSQLASDQHRQHAQQYRITPTLAISQRMDGSAVSRIRASPCSTMAATASWSGAVKLWDLPSGQLRHEFAGHSNTKVGALAFGPSGNILASGGYDGSLHLWNVHSREAITRISTSHAGRIGSVEFHPNGKHLVSTGYDNTWRLWDVTSTGAPLLTQPGHANAVHACSIHPDGSLLATAGLDKAVYIWDLRTGRAIASFSDSAEALYACAWNPYDGYHLATGGADNSIRMYDLRQVKQIQTIAASSSLISDLYFGQCDENGAKVLASSSFDGTVKLWSTGEGHHQSHQVGSIPSHPGGKTASVTIAPNGSWMAASGFDSSFKVWTFSDDDDTLTF